MEVMSLLEARGIKCEMFVPTVPREGRVMRLAKERGKEVSARMAGHQAAKRIKSREPVIPFTRLQTT